MFIGLKDGLQQVLDFLPLVITESFFFFFFFFFFFCLFRAAYTAYGGSQARGPIGAVAAGLYQSHSNTGSGCDCNLYHSSWQRQILNPLSEARDQTRVLMDSSQVH